MIELALTQAAFAPERRRVTRDYLNAILLWPAFGQAKRQGEFLDTWAAVRALEEAEALPATMHVGIARQALCAMPPASFEAELTRRWAEGVIVGEYYALALGLDRVAGVPVSVKQLREFATRPERRKAHTALNIGPSKLRDLLREYRPACHLWAARFAMPYVAPVGWVADDDMPCPLEHIAEFLALAEFIADSLASIRLEQRGKDRPLLLPRADLWRVPANVRLPEVDWPRGMRPGVAPLDVTGDILWKLDALLPPTH